MHEIVLDIGANQGDFALAVAAARADITVIAVEPISELCAHISARSSEMAIDNLVVVETAIDEVPRTAVINVSRHADWGVSSLLPFNSQTVADDPYWSGRTDLYYDEERRIGSRRLDDILEPYGDCVIQFAKVDAQGLDLRVLKSLGVRLSALSGGIVETSTCTDTRLHDGEIEDLACTLNWLAANSFDVYAIKPNDHACNEANIFFHRRGADWRKWKMTSISREYPYMMGSISGICRRTACCIPRRRSRKPARRIAG